MEKLPLYWDWIKIEAKAIASDGCTKVIDFRKKCCEEHDLAYYYAKCPRDAYRLYLEGASEPWREAKPIGRSQADGFIRDCYKREAEVSWFPLLSWTRWIGTRVGGLKAWNRHREREKNAQLAD